MSIDDGKKPDIQLLFKKIAKWRQSYLRIGAAFCLILLMLAMSADIIPSSLSSGQQASSQHIPDSLIDLYSQNAFCIFLDSDPDIADESLDKDMYFISARMIIYQLLHNETTRSDPSIPVIVLVTQMTSQLKRDRLIADGAIVVEVDSLAKDKKLAWITPARPRWKRAMEKLHVFKFTQFEKILLLDADIVVVRKLQGIFSSPETSLRETGDVLTPARVKESGETPQPSDYIFAASSGPSGTHSYPAARGTRLSPSFVVLRPSLEMYNNYLSIAHLEGRFKSGSPDTDLFNYVHRADANLPWTQLDGDWTINSPNYHDYEMGVKSLHEKWWRCGHDLPLRAVFLDIRWRMEGYWMAKEKLQQELKN